MLVVTVGTNKFNIAGTVESPDFSAVPTYARIAVEAAFSQGHYQYRADTPPDPEPNWESFNVAIFSNAEWQSWGIPQDLRTAIISAAVARLPEQLQTAYGNAKLVVPPSGPATAAWNTIASQFNIPLEF